MIYTRALSFIFLFSVFLSMSSMKSQSTGLTRYLEEPKPEWMVELSQQTDRIDGLNLTN